MHSFSRRRLQYKKLSMSCPFFMQSLSSGEMDRVVRLLRERGLGLKPVDWQALHGLETLWQEKTPLFYKALSSGQLHRAFAIVNDSTYTAPYN